MTMDEETHYPVTLSSKPYPQAKHTTPEGSQSLQLGGQDVVKMKRMIRRGSTLTVELSVII